MHQCHRLICYGSVRLVYLNLPGGFRLNRENGKRKREWERGKGIESKRDSFEVKVSGNAENKGNEKIFFCFSRVRYPVHLQQNCWGFKTAISCFLLVPRSCNLLWVVCLLLLVLPNLYAFSCSHRFCCWLEFHLHLSGNLSLGQKFIEKKPSLGWQRRMQTLIIFSAFLSLQLGYSWGTKF